MSQEYSENTIEKVDAQPLCHDPTWVDPADDDGGGGPDTAQGFLLAVWCDAPPTDGDIAVYVAANTRFELQPQSSLSAAVTASDGAGGFALVFAEDGTIVTT